MKKKEKSRRPEKPFMEAEGQQKKPKLKPTEREKYRVRNVLLDEDEDSEINLFNFDND